MAGVSSASPKNMPAPQMAIRKRSGVRRPMVRDTSAIRDSVPPSPLLSRRVRMKMYLIVTTMISDHSISEITPRTSSRNSGIVVRSVSGPTAMPAASWLRTLIW